VGSIQQHLIPNSEADITAALIQQRLAAILVLLEKSPYLARHVVHELSDS